jgi:hypothetical protein
MSEHDYTDLQMLRIRLNKLILIIRAIRAIRFKQQRIDSWLLKARRFENFLTTVNKKGANKLLLINN